MDFVHDFVHRDQTDVRKSYDHSPDLDLDQKHHSDHSHDLESQKEKPLSHPAVVTNAGDVESEEIILARELQQRNSFLGRLRRGEEWLDEKMGIETQGIDRIHEEDKQPPSLINVFFLWWSMTCHVGTLPIGLLGPEVYGLSLPLSVTCIVVGTILGATCTAFTGTLGPKVFLFIPCLRSSSRSGNP